MNMKISLTILVLFQIVPSLAYRRTLWNRWHQTKRPFANEKRPEMIDMVQQKNLLQMIKEWARQKKAKTADNQRVSRRVVYTLF